MEDRLRNEYNGMVSLFPHSCDESPNQPCLACFASTEAYQEACGVPQGTNVIPALPRSANVCTTGERVTNPQNLPVLIVSTS
jgi:hypothetical protein